MDTPSLPAGFGRQPSRVPQRPLGLLFFKVIDAFLMAEGHPLGSEHAERVYLSLTESASARPG